MKRLGILFLAIGVFFSCARRGSITGGSKDSIPPVLVKAKPTIKTTHFDKKKIKIYFNEYVKVKDLKKNLIISPPQKNDPEITPLGTASKVITIKILDTLRPNTTYSFNFGNSIIDNNEGNELGNFTYVFSTGSYIDSLSVSGKVKDPIVGDKLKRVNVALYKYDSTFTDSIIYKKRPDYITSTLDTFLFKINNLKKGKYLLIALKDKNGNKKFEPKSDKIGFLRDTLSLPTNQKFTLSIFKEVPEFRVFKPREVSRGHLIFGFEGDASGMNIKLKQKLPDTIFSKFIFEKEKDTVHFWYTPFKTDSLNFIVSKNDIEEEWTAKMRSSSIDSLQIKKNTPSKFHLLDTFSINSNIPIVKIDGSKIKITVNDTIVVPFNPFLSKDSTQLYLNFDKKEKTAYKIDLLPYSVTDMFQQTNDTTSYKVTTDAFEDYVSMVKFTPKGKENIPLIVELLKDKKVVKKAYTKTGSSVEFKWLLPGEYKVRVVLDKNGNRRWDTGSFLEKQQPEIIKNYPTELKLQAGWEYLDNILLID